ncbi:MAG: ABC transporter permease [Clostridiaceae bacterium]
MQAKAKINLFKNRITGRIFWIAVFVVLWQAVAMSGAFSPMIFPGIDIIIKALAQGLKNGDLVYAVGYSMKLIVYGLLIGIALGVALAVLSSTSAVFESFVDTVISIAHPLPGIAMLPLIILWIGTGEAAIIFIIIHSVTWPLVLNLITGFKAMPAVYKKTAANYELSSLQKAVYISLPASFPYFISGIKTGWARAWRALISAEMLFGATGGIGGIGWFIFKKRVFMDTPGIFAGLLVIIIIGILVEELLLEKLERCTLGKWGMS